MNRQGWTATGVIEAPPERVCDTFLAVREGPIGADNAPLLRALPGAGRLLGSATLTGGPQHFTLHYGTHPGGTVRFQFWLGGKFKVGLRGCLTTIGGRLGRPADPGS